MAEPSSKSAHSQQEEDGATPSELIIEAARRNNTDLLRDTLAACANPAAAAALLNNATTVLGNHAYHEAASRGHWDIIDLMLDQDGFECDPISRREGDTPLHSAVRWINEQGEKAWEYGNELIGMMCEAGGDPRIRNKAKLKPCDLADPRNKKLRDKLADAEFHYQNPSDLIPDKDAIDRDAEEDEAVGSASDSD